jgi:DNA-binding MarR family transcriptional regulator
MPDNSGFKYLDNIPHKVHELSNLYAKSAIRQFKRLFDLGRSEARILNMIGNYGPISAAEMSKSSSFNKSLVSRAIKKLDENGYIKQKKENDGKRRRQLELSPKGKKLFAKSSAMGLDRFIEAMEGLSQEEIKFTERIIEQLIDNAKRMHEKEVELARIKRGGQ